MGTVKVCDEGLSALAGHCAKTAAQLIGQIPTPVPVPPAQATASAVGNAYTEVGVTAVVLAARVQTTASRLTASASQYVRTDEATAQQLSGLDEGPGQG